MPTISAIAVTPGDLTSIQRIRIDAPEPGPTGVLIDVIRCGICGTDREVASGHVGEPPTGRPHIILGHELLGRIARVGQDVPDLSPGDLVTATVRRPDGCPSCLQGHPDMCEWLDYSERGIQGLDGFLAEQVVVDRPYVIPVPEHLEPTGVLIEPLTVVEKAVRQAMLIQQRMPRWTPRTAIVTGAGPIGILGTLLLRSMGIDVYTVARTPAPNATATLIERSGARYISTQQHSLANIAAGNGNVDLVLECTGSSQVAFDAMQVLGINGVLVLLSITDDAVHFDVPAGAINNRLVTGNRVVVGSVNAGTEDFANATIRLDTFENLWPGLAQTIITHRIPYDGDLSGILLEPQDAIKTVVEFGSINP